MKCLCVAGRTGSGKSTFLKLSSSLNIPSFDMSSVVYEEIKRRNLDMNVLSVLEFSIGWREREGIDVVARTLFYKKVSPILPSPLVVIVGLRQKEEFEFFSKKFEQALLLFIESSLEERYKRIAQRRKESNPLSFSEFSEKDWIESLQGLDELYSLSHISITNNSSLEDFEKKVISFLKFLQSD